MPARFRPGPARPGPARFEHFRFFWAFWFLGFFTGLKGLNMFLIFYCFILYLYAFVNEFIRPGPGRPRAGTGPAQVLFIIKYIIFNIKNIVLYVKYWYFDEKFMIWRCPFVPGGFLACLVARRMVPAFKNQPNDQTN